MDELILALIALVLFNQCMEKREKWFALMWLIVCFFGIGVTITKSLA